MRNLYQSDHPSSVQKSAHYRKKRNSGNIGTSIGMDYPSGGAGDNFGRDERYRQRKQPHQQEQHQTSQQRQTHPESRQPQHRGTYSQQRQQPIQQHPLGYAQQAHLPPSYVNLNLYGQSEQTPLGPSSAQAIEAEYLRQQQQYLQQQQQQIAYNASAGHPGATAAAVAMGGMSYQQQLAMQQQFAGMYPSTVNPMVGGQTPMMQPPQPPPPLQQQQKQPPNVYPHLKVGRLPAERPLMKLSVSLIDTYKHINTLYYEERDARRVARAKDKEKKDAPGATKSVTKSVSNLTQKPTSNAAIPGSHISAGVNNSGWDDEHYDYIINPGELFYGRYIIKERIGKGSFGQVVRAEDTHERCDVAIKIIKSKKPFLMQAKTEIELLVRLNEKDANDENNIVRLLTHFIHRNHQCLVFEMLSLNLYELLKNTQFGGVSLNLIRKFASQVLKSLSFLARKDVDIIHCDLKPENILLKHPKRSGIKVIDFGSSCRSNKRMYSYIQSRFYRSPEVMLGLSYNTSIDIWSLGCILAEMHTGEPLFSGSDQFDQMQKIVKILGMLPTSMLEKANDQHRLQFFERTTTINRSSGHFEWKIKQVSSNTTSNNSAKSNNASQSASSSIVPSSNPLLTLSEVIRGDNSRKKKYPTTETGNSTFNYDLFVDLIFRMLAYDPRERIRPEDALNHPFITEQYNNSNN